MRSQGILQASAMHLLAEHLNISMDNTWAFGDSSNDLPMFEAAAHGIAMGEHSPILEPFSEMITDTVDNHASPRHFYILDSSKIRGFPAHKGLTQIYLSASAPFLTISTSNIIHKADVYLSVILQ